MTTFLIYHEGWHIVRPGAIADYRSPEDTTTPGEIRLAWFDTTTEGCVCFDGEPMLTAELTDHDRPAVVFRAPVFDNKTAADIGWRDWSPTESGGWPASLDAAAEIDVQYKNGVKKFAVRRGDVDWDRVAGWRLCRG